MVNGIGTFVLDENGWQTISGIKARAKLFSKYIYTVGFYLGHFHGYEVLAAEFNDKAGRPRAG